MRKIGILLIVLLAAGSIYAQTEKMVHLSPEEMMRFMTVKVSKINEKKGTCLLMRGSKKHRVDLPEDYPITVGDKFLVKKESIYVNKLGWVDLMEYPK